MYKPHRVLGAALAVVPVQATRGLLPLRAAGVRQWGTSGLPCSCWQPVVEKLSGLRYSVLSRQYKLNNKQRLKMAMERVLSA
jgi:hypothetical protein